LKVATIVGTRPEFIQLGPLTKTLRKTGHTEILVNTGQHYDDNMSQIFFRELQLPQPDFNLGVGSGRHGLQTGQMMIRVEEVLMEEKPDFVAVYGDTNSTIAGALVAAKLHLPIVHVESGLRSFDRNMPEEINRIVTDHISDILFAPTEKALRNLANEGITNGVCNVGDVRIDVLQDIQARAAERIVSLREAYNMPVEGDFVLATIHRAENTDQQARLSSIVSTINGLDMPVVLPVHPRLRKMLRKFDLSFNNNVCGVDPVGYFDMITLLGNCRIVVTDSGGLQKEAYMLKRPAITLRDSTEWVETVDAGWNRLCEPNATEFKAALTAALGETPASHPSFYGEPGVGQRMVRVLEDRVTVE
jgi:UDP-GlcNAc3NAcA epimerase